MKHKPYTLINVQSLAEPQRAKYRRKVYDCYRAGMTKYAAAKKCRIQETTVGRWYRRFDAVGVAAVHGGKRGPKPGGEKHKLSDEQLKALKRVVVDKTPDQLKFDFALWSSKAIKEYVQSKYGLSISRRTARRYMQKMGFTYQCPVKAAREQNPVLVKKWLETDYPAIRKEAAESGSTIYWADESSVLTCATKARGYSPVGVSPVLAAPANRSIRCNMISAVSNRGEMHFMVFDGAMNADVFKDFMVRLMRDSPCRVFLIVDNLRVHHATVLGKWLKENSRKIKLFYLPSYSPELNPDEYLNRDVKASLAEKKRPLTAKALKADVVSHLTARQNAPEAVKRLFHKKEVRYAAD